MEAIQKKRMHRIAVIHFVLTALTAIIIFEFFTQTYGQKNIREVISELGNDVSFVFCFLQPQFWIVTSGKYPFPTPFLMAAGLSSIPMLISIPIWSLCFGWIFVKMAGRVNNFSSLGKEESKSANHES